MSEPEEEEPQQQPLDQPEDSTASADANAAGEGAAESGTETLKPDEDTATMDAATGSATEGDSNQDAAERTATNSTTQGAATGSKANKTTNGDREEDYAEWEEEPPQDETELLKAIEPPAAADTTVTNPIGTKKRKTGLKKKGPPSKTAQKMAAAAAAAAAAAVAAQEQKRQDQTAEEEAAILQPSDKCLCGWPNCAQLQAQLPQGDSRKGLVAVTSLGKKNAALWRAFERYLVAPTTDKPAVNETDHGKGKEDEKIMEVKNSENDKQEEKEKPENSEKEKEGKPENSEKETSITEEGDVVLEAGTATTASEVPAKPERNMKRAVIAKHHWTKALLDIHATTKRKFTTHLTLPEACRQLHMVDKKDSFKHSKTHEVHYVQAPNVPLHVVEQSCWADDTDDAEGTDAHKEAALQISNRNDVIDRLVKENNRLKTQVAKHKDSNNDLLRQLKKFDKIKALAASPHWISTNALLEFVNNHYGGLTRYTIQSDEWHRNNPSAAKELFGYPTWAATKESIAEQFPSLVEKGPITTPPRLFQSKKGVLQLDDVSEFEKCLCVKLMDRTGLTKSRAALLFGRQDRTVTYWRQAWCSQWGISRDGLEQSKHKAHLNQATRKTPRTSSKTVNTKKAAAAELKGTNRKRKAIETTEAVEANGPTTDTAGNHNNMEGHSQLPPLNLIHHQHHPYQQQPPQLVLQQQQQHQFHHGALPGHLQQPHHQVNTGATPNHLQQQQLAPPVQHQHQPQHQQQLQQQQQPHLQQLQNQHQQVPQMQQQQQQHNAAAAVQFPAFPGYQQFLQQQQQQVQHQQVQQQQPQNSHQNQQHHHQQQQQQQQQGGFPAFVPDAETAAAMAAATAAVGASPAGGAQNKQRRTMYNPYAQL